MTATQGIRAGRAFVELGTNDSKLVRGLRRAKQRLQAFGAGVRSIGLKTMGLGTSGLAPLLGAAKVFSTMGDQVAKMAKRTGLSVETLSELRFVASQTGTEFASLEMGFRRMQRSIYDAGRGLSTAKDALTDLGLKFEDLDGLSPEQQFKLLGETIGRIEDPTKKAAIAMTLFGRTGTNLLPMFAMGAAGIEKLQKEARRLGLTMSSEDAKAAEDFTDVLDALWKTVKMGVFRVGAALAPTLEQLAIKITGCRHEDRQLDPGQSPDHRHGHESRRRCDGGRCHVDRDRRGGPGAGVYVRRAGVDRIGDRNGLRITTISNRCVGLAAWIGNNSGSRTGFRVPGDVRRRR